MSVDFKTFSKVAPLILAAKLPVLLRGRHGVGKSEVVYQTAKSIGLPVVERRASQMTEGDLVGLPDVDNTALIGGHKSTSFCPPDWFLMAVAEPVVLFFDEVDRAVPEVRQGLFELMDSRKLNGVTIHPDTVVIAAVNGGEHGAQYQVHEMDPAELDRYSVFDIEPTVEDWLDWGKDNVAALTWDFVNNNRSHLEHLGDFEPNKVYPSRRSWKRLNDTADAANLLRQDGDLDTLFTLATAFVGFEAAVSFRDYAANYTKVVTPEMIIVDGKIELTKEFAMTDHLALIDKMDASGSIKEELSDEQVGNLSDYFKSLPSEAAMALWGKIGMANEANAIALHGKCSDYLIKILAGDSE